jgi:hypothetical protein
MAWPSGRVRGRVVSRSNHLSDRAGDVARLIRGNSGFQRPNPEGESWAFETGSPFRMEKRGLKKTDFKVGSEVILSGFAAKDSSRNAAGMTITFPDREASFPDREATFLLAWMYLCSACGRAAGRPDATGPEQRQPAAQRSQPVNKSR